MSREDGFSAQEIRAHIVNKNLQYIPIFFYEETDSTNTRAKFYEGDLGKCALFVADSQSAGRGRLGRRFHSLSGTGIYMSVLSKCEVGITDPALITVRAAVAVCRAIESLAPIKPKIKWVNDIIYDGKKLAGILTEGVIEDSGKITKTICGIGINVLKRELPEEIKNLALSIEEACGVKLSRSALCARILEEFLAHTPWEEIIEEYRARCTLIGKDITVYKAECEPYPAKALAIDERGRLLVRLENGKEECLSSGEVSVKRVLSF